MKIIWSPLALERIKEISEYISRDNLSAAENWVLTIFEKVKKLQDFPQIGRVVPEVERHEIRELIYGKYRILYRISEDFISILTVRHGRQLLDLDEIIQGN
ncbi:MAG TPA: type II toxin-antitoxin system RelE/ParE family toxin [Candidatus Wolfebacteria bacterium]|nr:type II toxin-antitoxin system RelE/ParE family toxin [Candidatus Wolfebacteria bacterium]